ncbi:MAG TPA: glycosyl hydrolase family 18 protein [Nocardioides sp.]|nr:glycosyl hydrolase family 18 protein [Nocardioides sp.]
MRLVALGAVLAVVGGLLAPSPAVARVPDGLEVTGWIIDDGHNLVRKNHGGITTLSIVGVPIWRSGEGVRRATYEMDDLSRHGHDFDLHTELLVSNYSNRLGDFDPVALHRLLSSPENRAAVVDRLVLEQYDYDGFNVDFERVRAADGPGLVAFVEELQAALPEASTVSVDISAATSVRSYRQRGYRLARLAGAADVVDVMTYDQHGPWSRPGPVGALDWQRDALDALLSVVPATQVQLGVAGYGYTWPRHGRGRSLTVRQVRSTIKRDGATAHWRPGPGEWTTRLSDGTRLWWSDGRSYEERVALAREYGVRGLAVWRIGSADTLR